MPPTKKLTKALKELITLLEEEASRNPEFAQRLDDITSELPAQFKKVRNKSPRLRLALDVPDVFASLEERGEEEFRFWLRTLDIPTLKAIIKVYGLDAAKASTRWIDKDKFMTLVAEQTIAQRKRGSAFLPPKGASQKAN